MNRAEARQAQLKKRVRVGMRMAVRAMAVRGMAVRGMAAAAMIKGMRCGRAEAGVGDGELEAGGRAVVGLWGGAAQRVCGGEVGSGVLVWWFTTYL